jgi:hypothetical protein
VPCAADFWESKLVHCDNYHKSTLLEPLASLLASHLKNISLLEPLEQEISTA